MQTLLAGPALLGPNILKKPALRDTVMTLALGIGANTVSSVSWMRCCFSRCHILSRTH